jgi:hypothetical protein
MYSIVPVTNEIPLVHLPTVSKKFANAFDWTLFYYYYTDSAG